MKSYLKSAIGSLTALSLLMVISALAVVPVRATPSDSMWIEPPSKDLTGFTNGTRFNMTVWLNVTTPINSWQFSVLYDPNYLNATRCGYTGVGKSLWSEDLPTQSVIATFDEWGDYGFVQFGEVLATLLPNPPPEKTGVNSLAWIEFKVIRDSSFEGELAFGRAGDHGSSVWDTFAWDGDFNDVPLTLYPAYTVPEFALSGLLIAFLVLTSGLAAASYRLRKNKHLP